MNNNPWKYESQMQGGRQLREFLKSDVEQNEEDHLLQTL